MLFNVKYTTENDTYRHPLSLHDPLPILVRGPDDPHLRHLVAFAAIGEVAADAALVRAAVGDAHLDAVILEQLGDAFDVLEPGAGEDLSHRMLTASPARARRSEEHTSELQSLMRISYAVFCLKKKKH